MPIFGCPLQNQLSTYPIQYIFRKFTFLTEHLKQELGEAQDDLDNSATSIRKLERSNEEFSSQCEGLQVQVEHLTSR